MQKQRTTLVHALRMSVVLIVLCLSAMRVYGQDINPKSYALLLYNIAKNTTYPVGKTTFTFAVYGKSPVLAELQKIAKTKKVHNLTIVVKEIATPQEALYADLVYLPDNKSKDIKKINDVIKGRPILLVAEREDYALKGAAFSFAIDDDDTLRFDINTAILRQQGLSAAPSLLQAADQVY